MMGSKAKLGIVSLIALAGIMSFQNCGSSMQTSNPLYDKEEASMCVGAACVRDVQYLNIYVGNTDPLLIQRNTERSLDLAGYCDNAGFASTKIYAQLKSGTTSVLGPFNTGAKCDANGRFRVLVNLPSNYNYDLAYTVVLIFRGIDENGGEYEHPTGVNRREIAVLTAP